MRRTFIVLAAVLVGIGLTTGALAVSVHWKKGSPTFTDNGLSLTESGTVAGVGGGDLAFVLVAQGNPTAECLNPGSGEHRPPGHNPASVTLTGVTPIPSSAIKNGNASYTVQTDEPESPVDPSSADFSCPNKSWTENITDVAFTSASLTILQDTNGSADQTPPIDLSTYEATVFSGAQGTCSFSPATSDGPVSSFSCPK